MSVWIIHAIEQQFVVTLLEDTLAPASQDSLVILIQLGAEDLASVPAITNVLHHLCAMKTNARIHVTLHNVEAERFAMLLVDHLSALALLEVQETLPSNVWHLSALIHLNVRLTNLVLTIGVLTHALFRECVD